MPTPSISVRQIALEAGIAPERAIAYVQSVYDDFDPLRDKKIFNLMRGEFADDFRQQVAKLDPNLLEPSSMTSRARSQQRTQHHETVSGGFRKSIIESAFMKPSSDGKDFLLSPIAADLIDIPSLKLAEYKRNPGRRSANAEAEQGAAIPWSGLLQQTGHRNMESVKGRKYRMGGSEKPPGRS
jgi:hypothetical protein